MNKSRPVQVISVCLILIALTSVAYWQVGGHDFIRNFDDGVYACDNPFVKGGLTAKGLAWAFSIDSRNYGCNWHPLTWISLMADSTIYGMNSAHPFHVVNLVLHIAGVLLLLLLLFMMTGRLWPSAFVAALFALHPLHVESVAWIAERKDVLSTMFWMLTMLAYLWHARRPSLGRYLLVALTFALGLMSKPMLVTLPIVLVLMDFWPLRRSEKWGMLVIEKLPLLGLSAGAAAMTWIAQQGGGAVASTDVFDRGVRVANALVSTVDYLCKMFYPARLAVFYPHPGSSLPVWQVAGSALIVAGLTALAVATRKTRPYILVGWLWYIITLLPVIGLVQVGMQAMADRYTYVPLIGIFIAIAWTGFDLVAKPKKTADKKAKKQAPEPMTAPRIGLASAAILIVLVLAGLTWRQVSYWNDGETLFRHALDVTEGNYRAENNVGLALVARGRYDEAEEHYRTAIAIDHNFAEAVNNLGQVLYFKGDYAGAADCYKKAASLDARTGVAAGCNYALALAAIGRHEEAIRQYRAVLKLVPDNMPLHLNLAKSLVKTGHTDQAIEEIKVIFHTDPASPDAQIALARIYSTNLDSRYRNGVEAVRLAEQACSASPRPSPFFLRTLAGAYAESGRYDQAVSAANKAIEAGRAVGIDLRKAMAAEQRCYRQHQPWRE